MKPLPISCPLAFVLSLAPTFAPAGSIAAADAKNHVGEQATVCGKVASERTAASSRGQPTFINLDSPYPNQVFTILVWGDNKGTVGELPQMGDHACAKGLIESYRGVAEIVVRRSGQLSRWNWLVLSLTKTTGVVRVRNDQAVDDWGRGGFGDGLAADFESGDAPIRQFAYWVHQTSKIVG
jgi:hypothetical protein